MAYSESSGEQGQVFTFDRLTLGKSYGAGVSMVEFKTFSEREQQVMNGVVGVLTRPTDSFASGGGRTRMYPRIL